MRLEKGAAWVGTQSYGTYSQLALEGGVKAPLLQVIERDRYWKTSADHPDFSRPGLLVDLSRRMRWSAPFIRRTAPSVLRGMRSSRIAFHRSRAASPSGGRCAPVSYPLFERWKNSTRSPSGPSHHAASPAGHRAPPYPREAMIDVHPKPRASIGSAAG